MTDAVRPIRPIDFHRRLPGYAPTRIEELPPPDAASVRRMVIKLETGRFGLPSFKVLGASWASARRVSAWLGDVPPDFVALRGALRERGRPARLVAATDGNHGRAVAWSARQLGLAAEIFVPRGTAPARVAGIESEGATVSVVSGHYDDAVAAAAQAADDEAGRLLVQDTAVPGHEWVVEEIVRGYATIFEELDDQLGGDEPVVAVVVPVGVGSLAVAAARHYRDRPGARLVTVEPSDADSLRRSLAAGGLQSVPGPHRSVMVGLRCGTISAAAWPELAGSVAESVALEDEEADAAMRDLAERGIEVGECGAAALAATTQLAASGRLAQLAGDAGATAVLLATEAPTDPARWERVIGRAPGQR